MTPWQSTVPVFQPALTDAIAANATVQAMNPTVQVGFGEQVMPEAQYVWLRDVSAYQFKPVLIARGVYPSDETYQQDVLIYVRTPDDLTPVLATQSVWALWNAVTAVLAADPSVGGVVRTCIPSTAQNWGYTGAEYGSCRLLGRLKVEARI